jgi:hypothetical protein
MHSEVDIRWATGTNLLIGFWAAPISSYHVANSTVCCRCGRGDVGKAAALSKRGITFTARLAAMPSCHTSTGVRLVRAQGVVKREPRSDAMGFAAIGVAWPGGPAVHPARSD